MDKELLDYWKEVRKTIGTFDGIIQGYEQTLLTATSVLVSVAIALVGLPSTITGETEPSAYWLILSGFGAGGVVLTYAVSSRVWATLKLLQAAVTVGKQVELTLLAGEAALAPGLTADLDSALSEQAQKAHVKLMAGLFFGAYSFLIVLGFLAFHHSI